MESTKKQEWDWRFKIKLAVAAFALASFFLAPWMMMAADMFLSGSMKPAALDLAATQDAQRQKERQRQ